MRILAMGLVMATLIPLAHQAFSKHEDGSALSSRSQEILAANQWPLRLSYQTLQKELSQAFTPDGDLRTVAGLKAYLSEFGTFESCGRDCWMFIDHQENMRSPGSLPNSDEGLEHLSRWFSGQGEGLILLSRYKGFAVPAYNGLIFDKQSGRIKSRLSLKNSSLRPDQQLPKALAQLREYAPDSRSWAQLLPDHLGEIEAHADSVELQSHNGFSEMLEASKTLRELMAVYAVRTQMKTQVVFSGFGGSEFGTELLDSLYQTISTPEGSAVEKVIVLSKTGGAEIRRQR